MLEKNSQFFSRVLQTTRISALVCVSVFLAACGGEDATENTLTNQQQDTLQTIESASPETPIPDASSQNTSTFDTMTSQPSEQASNQTPEQTEPASPSQVNNFSSMAEEMLNAVNLARSQGRSCGSQFMPSVQPLSLNNQLLQAAQLHSDDMASMRRMSHTGSNGSTFSERIQNTGYAMRAGGENVAFNQRSVQQVMNAWLTSPGHCRNIMGAQYTEFGMGMNNYYWTQLFATPR